MKKKFFTNKFYSGTLILLTNSSICFGGGEDNDETIIETQKLHNIAIDPKPSGEIPNHHSDFGGISPNHPNLNFII